MPGTKHTINLSFEPNNLGVFNNVMELAFLKGAYKIPLKLLGSAHVVGQKEKGIRGPAATKEDFEPKRNYVSSQEVEIAPNKRTTNKGGETGIPRFLQDSTLMHMDESIELENTEKLDQYLQI